MTKWSVGITVSVLAVVIALVAAPVGAAKRGDDIRVAGVCTNASTSKLKLSAEDRGIEVEFEVDHNRIGAPWRVVLVHERRVAWKGTVRTRGPSGSFDVERRVRDLPGADAFTARAWGPGGVTCRATGTLPG